MIEATKEEFNAAFNCICRAVAITYATDETYQIKVSHAGGTKLLPQATLDLFENRSINEMQKIFCLGNKQDAIKLLIDIFRTKKVQPKEYIFYGLLSVKKEQISLLQHYDDKRYGS